MSHQKKPFEQLLKGKYPIEKKKCAVRDVLNGILTSREAEEKYGVPRRTIQENVQYVYWE